MKRLKHLLISFAFALLLLPAVSNNNVHAKIVTGRITQTTVTAISGVGGATKVVYQVYDGKGRVSNTTYYCRFDIYINDSSGNPISHSDTGNIKYSARKGDPGTYDASWWTTMNGDINPACSNTVYIDTTHVSTSLNWYIDYTFYVPDNPVFDGVLASGNLRVIKGL